MTIPEDRVRQVSGKDGLLDFLREQLSWPIPPVEAEDLLYRWLPEDLRMGESEAAKAGTIYQLAPMRAEQPWGIFLIHLAAPRLYKTHLRRALRGLVPSRRGQPSRPTWQRENLLFICTPDWREFTFAHFEGRQARTGQRAPAARLSTFGWHPQEPTRTLREFNLPALEYQEERHADPNKWLEDWAAAWDVQKVTDDFFEGYENVFKQLEKDLAKQTRDAQWAHDYGLQLLNRVMFLYFIQRKGWLGGDTGFIPNFWEHYKAASEPKHSFFHNWLSVLFFEAFNNGFAPRDYFPQDINNALRSAPFLNGGLFRRNRLDEKYDANVPDSLFTLLFDEFDERSPGFLERYNFTIEETTPLDVNVAVDPEMIGRVYESLVNVTFEQSQEAAADRRREAGIFYTERVEIDLMCRLALVDNLANHLAQEHKPLLYEAVFAYDLAEKSDADKALSQRNLWPDLNRALREITVLDPACGSGSFLVGMLLVLDDLIERANKQLGTEETAYERRRRIIGRSLYGVDVMDWAVHVAELRLWLQLVVETELAAAELKFRPLLPDLSFKVRQGDSLVQEVGGVNLGLQRGQLPISTRLKGRLTRLKAEKLKFYNNDPSAKFPSDRMLRQEELSVFRDILDERAQDLDKRLKEIRQSLQPQQFLLGEVGVLVDKKTRKSAQELRAEQKELEAQGQQVQEAREALRTAKDIPFVWDIAFVEIFAGDNQGFDIVIGNPPYVRKERIKDPIERWDEATAESRRAYKRKLAVSAYQAYPQYFGHEGSRRRISGQADYYVHFYLHGLRLLNPSGSFCFITSNSWLDVGYGAALQEFLLHNCRIKMILDNQKKRSFAHSDINTIITLFSAPTGSGQQVVPYTARFVMFTVPFEEALSPVIFQEIEEARDRKSTPEYRIHPVGQAELTEAGMAVTEGEEPPGVTPKAPRYVGDKWGGKYLRAPDIYWTILQKAGTRLVRLSSLCRVEGYIHDNNTGRAFPKAPFVKSVKDLDRIQLTRESAGVVSYGVRATGASRKVAPLLFPRTFGSRHLVAWNTGAVFGKEFYKITPTRNDMVVSVAWQMNSTFAILQREIIGLADLGGGAIKFSGDDVGLFLLLPDLPSSAVTASFGRLADRPLFEMPKDLQQRDRKELDAVIFDALGLTEGELEAVYEAVIELVEARLRKAESLQPGRRRPRLQENKEEEDDAE